MSQRYYCVWFQSVTSGYQRMCVCVCVCACARARVCVRASECMYACVCVLCISLRAIELILISDSVQAPRFVNFAELFFIRFLFSYRGKGGSGHSNTSLPILHR